MRVGLQTMRPSLNFGSWGPTIDANVAMIRFAESAGYDSVWTSEKLGTDAIVPLTWLAAHTERIKVGTGVLQLTAREPTTTAMTAATLDLYTGGRVLLGLGVSGPGVVEAWHNVTFDDPVGRTREYVEIVRKAIARTGPLEHRGRHYQLPLARAEGSVPPMRLAIRPRRRRIPIYLAAMGPRNLQLAYDLADGVIPAFYSPWREDRFFEGVERGDRRVDLAPYLPIQLGDDLERCRDRQRSALAYWLGGMGTTTVNFYGELVARLGFEDAARRCLEHYAAGRTREAIASIPDQLIDETCLVGPSERIADQLAAWRESSVDTVILTQADAEEVKAVAEILL